jgi:hypothetical protein
MKKERIWGMIVKAPKCFYSWGNNSQSTEEGKGDQTMKWFNAFTTLNLETLCLRLNCNQNQKWYIDLRHELHKK